MHYNLSVLFLASGTVPLVVGIVVAVLSIIGALVFCLFYKQNTEKKVGDANTQARKIVEDAEAEGEE